jgi:formiminoglutamase
MDNIKIFNNKDIAKITNHRSGEVKFGEKVLSLNSHDFSYKKIAESDATFVLVGLPEDIGIKANLGREGAASAFAETLSALMNFQHNKFCKGSDLLVLGELNCDKYMSESKELDINNKTDRKKLFELVAEIDKEVSHVVRNIIESNKIPIIVGGGHNNAYGNLKGLALAKGKPVNAINFDAHTDFRLMEGRHSGNGFSYVFEEGFLKKYFIFGLHENFVSKIVFDNIKQFSERVKYVTYEDIAVRKEKSFTAELVNATKFVSTDFFGLEFDMDALPNIHSSAMTLSGFSVEKARNFIYNLSKEANCSYIHICEGAPDLDQSNNNHLTGKLIATLITDFMKGKNQLLNSIKKE